MSYSSHQYLAALEQVVRSYDAMLSTMPRGAHKELIVKQRAVIVDLADTIAEANHLKENGAVN